MSGSNVASVLQTTTDDELGGIWKHTTNVHFTCRGRPFVEKFVIASRLHEIAARFQPFQHFPCRVEVQIVFAGKKPTITIYLESLINGFDKVALTAKQSAFELSRSLARDYPHLTASILILTKNPNNKKL